MTAAAQEHTPRQGSCPHTLHATYVSSGVDDLHVEAVYVEVVDAGTAMPHNASVFLTTTATLIGGSRWQPRSPVQLAEAALRLQYGSERGALPDPENNDSTKRTPTGVPTAFVTDTAPSAHRWARAEERLGEASRYRRPRRLLPLTESHLGEPAGPRPATAR